MGIKKRLSLLKRLLADPAFRWSVLGASKHSSSYFQKETYTKVNRYPFVFRAVAEYLAAHNTPKILSYGCATGEEAYTLSQYLPGANILGVDVNQWCVKRARKTYENNHVSFYLPSDDAYLQAHDFDAIFCMAVFQHTANRKNNPKIALNISFQSFENELFNLHKKLKTGGLLIIDHSDFLFQDTLLATQYKPLDFPQNLITRNRPAFNSSNERIADSQHIYRVFIKTS
jgi:hypothetical protein